MQIAASQVSLSAQSASRIEHSVEETTRAWIGPERPDFAQPAPAPPGAAQDRVDLSPAALASRFQRTSTPSPEPAASAEAPPPEDPRLLAMRLILEALSGRKIRVADMPPPCTAEAPVPIQGGQPGAQDATVPERAGWGLEYDRHETVREEEAMSFAAQGTVVTTDGRSIGFTVALAMSRSFVQETSFSLRAGDARLVDPIVINLDGTGGLTDTRFTFDLDLDGQEESIAFAAPGSGFLVFDRNADGRVNNGSELFGPASGSGFAELASLDRDGNGWLDEGDPIYAKLQVWMRDAAGGESLAPLASHGIAALCLGSAESPFSLKDGGNALLGQVARTGVYLTESGSAGTLQEVDLTV